MGGVEHDEGSVLPIVLVVRQATPVPRADFGTQTIMPHVVEVETVVIRVLCVGKTLLPIAPLSKWKSTDAPPLTIFGVTTHDRHASFG